MRVSFTDLFGDKKTDDFVNVMKNGIYYNAVDPVREARDKAEQAIKMCSMLVDMLYSKGILKDNNVKSFISGLGKDVDPAKPIIVFHEDCNLDGGY